MTTALIGIYPPLAKVYINDTVLTLIESIILSKNTSVPVVDISGRLSGVVYKSKALKWLYDRWTKGDIDSSVFFPLNETDLIDDPQFSIDISNLQNQTIKDFLLKKKVDEAYITSSSRLIGEINYSVFINLSLWTEEDGIKIESADRYQLSLINFEDPLSKAIEKLLDNIDLSPLGIIQQNSLVGVIYVEDIFEYLLEMMYDGDFKKLSLSKSWVLATTVFPYAYLDEPIYRVIRNLKRRGYRKWIILYDRNNEVKGYTGVRDLLNLLSDKIDMFMNLQTIT